MAKDKLSDYDGVTAGNNTDIGGISIDEGMLPSTVNNSLRELTKQLGAFADGTDGIDVLNLHDDDASASIKIQAPATVTTTTTLTLPDGAGSNGQVLTTNGSGTLSWSTAGGISDIVEDTTPQLGGNLDLNGNDITGTGNIDIAGNIELAKDAPQFDFNDTAGGTQVDYRLKVDAGEFSITDVTNSYEQVEIAGGIVKLRHNGSTKVSTSASGIDVTGTVTADGLTVDAGNSPITLSTGDSGYVKVTHPTRGGDYRLTTNGTAAEHFDIQNGTQKLARFSGSGDISFYDSTGSSQSLYWDASTQRLGLGNTTPTQTLDINGNARVDGAIYLADRIYHDGDTNTSIRFPAADTISLNTAGQERVYITSAGLIGVGTATPSYDIDVQVAGNATLNLNRTDASTAGQIYIESGNIQNNIHSSGVKDLVFSTNATEAMRITSGGDVNIYGTDNRPLAITSFNTVSAGAGWDLNATSGNGVVSISTSGNEAMRIDSGNLLVGKTSAVNTNNGAWLNPAGTSWFTATSDYPLGLNRLSSDGTIAQFRRSGTTVGSISVTTSGTTYNTTSDIRLKTDIAPIADATDKLMAMNAVTHKWKADPYTDAVVGFIAQEMAEIVPEAVSKGEGEDDMWSMDYGRITPVLVAALQDAHKKIEQLEQRIADMEAN